VGNVCENGGEVKEGRGEGRGVGVDGWFCPLLHIVLFFLALVVVAAAEECMICWRAWWG